MRLALFGLLFLMTANVVRAEEHEVQAPPAARAEVESDNLIYLLFQYALTGAYERGTVPAVSSVQGDQDKKMMCLEQRENGSVTKVYAYAHYFEEIPKFLNRPETEIRLRRRQENRGFQLSVFGSKSERDVSDAATERAKVSGGALAASPKAMPFTDAAISYSRSFAAGDETSQWRYDIRSLSRPVAGGKVGSHIVKYTETQQKAGQAARTLLSRICVETEE